MTGVTNAELAAALQQVIAQVDAREDQLKAWQSGAADEGPYADGRFPIVNLLGEIGYFKSPARLAHEVGLLTSSADGALAQCLAAQATAQAAAALSETKANTASTAAATATTKANQADTFRQQAANSEANALVHRNNASTSATTATTAATTAEDAAGVAVAAKDDAVIARNAAQAAAAAAATFNPADFYTKIVSDGRYVQLTNFNWGNLAGKPSTFAPSAHNHTIAEVTGLQTALDGKQAAGSYSVTGHGHVISDVSGLQTALDGKQPTGNYSLVGHGHVIADVSGLQTALDGKQAAGSYVTTANFTWANLSGKPTTFAPSAHVHAITDVTGLQTALDGKQATGNYSLVGHSHVIADVTGLQAALDGKQAAGSYVTTANFAWANLSGKPTTFTPSAHTHVISDVTGLQTALDGKQAAGSYAASVHSHAIGDVTGLSTQLTSKVTRRTGEVSLGVQTYGVTAWCADGATGAGFGGWARHLSVKAGELDSHAGFFAVYGWNTQAEEVRIGVGNADNGYTQGNALRITSSEMSWNGSLVWHGGNFSPASKSDVGHTHVIADVTGLQTALDGKQAAGSYVTTANFTWANLSGKPTTFTPSAHTHVISDVTGLQTALDGKQAAGSYAAASHTHDYLPLSGGSLSGNLNVTGTVGANSYTGFYFGQYLGDKFTVGNGQAAHYGLSFGDFNNAGDASALLSGYYGVRLATAGAVRLAIDTSGNVSIPGNLTVSSGGVVWHSGNFNPASKSDVGHTHSQYATLFTDNNFARLFTTGVTANGDLTTGADYAGLVTIGRYAASYPWSLIRPDAASAGFEFRTNSGTPLMSINQSSGNVGIAYNLAVGGQLSVSSLPVFPSRWTNDFQSISDFVNGTLVITDIPANVENGDSFEIEITGKSYNPSQPPFKVIAQGYIYANTFISASGISYGGQFADSIKVMERDGVLCFWWPRISYWNSFRVSVVTSMYPSNDTITRNRVTSIIDIAEPSVSKKVTISLHRSIMSDPGSFTHINRPYANLLSLLNNGGVGTRIQLADVNWSANIRHDSGNLMFQTQGENTRMFIGNGVVGIGTTSPNNLLQSSYGVPASVPSSGAGGHGFAVGSFGYGLTAGALTSGNGYLQVTRWDGSAANYHLMLQPNGGSVAVGNINPVTSIDTAGDITARGGNLFIRENPAGAGAGMRLHHTGGGAYIDFDGDLNFRDGDGSLHASIGGGAFLSNYVTALVSVAAQASGSGRVSMQSGNASNPGYLQWNTSDGVRRGYLGWSEGTNIVYQAENGWGLKFNTNFSVSGTTTLNGQVNSNGQIRATGWWLSPVASATALGVEIGATGSNGYVYSYNRDTSTYGPLRLGGSTIIAENPMTFSSSANMTGAVDVFSGNLRINSGGGDSAMGAYISYRNNLGAERGWVGYGEGTSRMRVYNGIGEVLIQGSGTTINSYGGGNVRLSTNSGYLDVGPLNSSYCHFGTDRPAFYFGQRVEFQDTPLRYQQGAFLHHSSTSLGSGSITVSTASPSGGSDGDIWIKVAS